MPQITNLAQVTSEGNTPGVPVWPELPEEPQYFSKNGVFVYCLDPALPRILEDEVLRPYSRFRNYFGK